VLLLRALRDAGDARARPGAILAVAITLVLMLVAPPGLPVLAAAAAALIGLRSTR
jgi:hypothetical protein